MGHTDTSTKAAAQLALLVDYFVELRASSPGGGRRSPTRSIENTAPLNVATLSHIHASVREIKEYVDIESPGTMEPLPKDPAGVYDWCIRNTEHDDEAVKRRRDTLIYRQYLEHKILAGDVKIVRRHRCPGCGTVGLHWRASVGSAVCRNRNCRTPDGLASTWTLAHLAAENIADKEKRSRRAT
ncbi:hypothetical protein [Streptomyces sp. NPDC056982]|uniref:hypothetical protein n=1 Tax=Streptomyces sp. NPDC056982 TaxID=3345986 RepID=UPI003642E139